MGESFIAIGDVHFPWANKKSVARVVELVSVLRPTYVIQMGDLYDMLSYSRYPGFQYSTAHAEIKDARNHAVKFWSEIRKASPKSKLHQLIGNHDERPVKRLQENPIFHPLVDIHKLWTFDGVHSQREEADELVLKINGERIMFMHGFRSRSGLGAHAIHNHMSTCVAHSHRGGCEFLRFGAKTIWELDCGFVGMDGRNPNVSYKRQRKVSKWTQGVGFCDELGPRFIPFKNG